MTRRARPLRRAGVLARRHARRLSQGRPAASCARAAWSARPRHLLSSPAAGGEPTLVTEDGVPAAVRRRERPRLLLTIEGDEDQSAPACVLPRSSSTAGRARALPSPSSRTEFASRPTAAGSPSARASTPTSRRSSRPGKPRRASARRARPCRSTRVSKDAGEYLHWSGDSQRLHWSLGPRALHARPQGRLRLPRRRAREAARRRRRRA